MRKTILLVLIGLAALMIFARMRLFIRDPFGSVSHNGVKEKRAQVYINFNNDVLLENDNPPLYTLLIQHREHFGVPAKLYCLHYLACLTDADAATLSAGTWNITIDEMTRRNVRYHTKDTQTVVSIF